MDVSDPKHLQKIYSDLSFLPERMKIEKCQKAVFSMYGKKNYVIHRKALKQALDYKLILERVRSVIKFNQEAWFKPFIDMNTELRRKIKIILRRTLS